MPLAAAMASFAALSTALLLTVQPDNASISADCAARIIFGSCSMAREPTPGVSFSPVAVTLMILPFCMETVTRTSPPNPCATAELSSANAAAAGMQSIRQSKMDRTRFM